MSTPTVTELPLRRERTTHDSFLDSNPRRAARAPVIRELDRRISDGIGVRLLWNQTDDRVRVAVLDTKSGDAFEIDTEPQEALDAFHHPYSYAASRGGRQHHTLVS